MFSRNLHKHEFEVQWYSTKSDSLIQLLYCHVCGKKFWGMGGNLKNPRIIHEIKRSTFSNPLESMNVIGKV